MSYQRKTKRHTHSARVPGRRRQRRTFSLAPEVIEYIEQVQKKQDIPSLSAAFEAIVRERFLAENQTRLEQDTAAYFQNLGPQAAAEERGLEAELWKTGASVDPDAEP